MNRNPLDFRPLIALTRIGLLLGFATFNYLLFGDLLTPVLEPSPFVTAAAERSNMPIASDNFDQIVDGIHVQTGLVYAEGFELVRGNCTACHSAKLVTQNRATRAGWTQMIRWMQATQGLWDLGNNEKPILDYLAQHYAPEEVGRRVNLDVVAIEWYMLELEEEPLVQEEIGEEH